MVNMISVTFVATYISFFHASMIARTWDPFSKFHSITIRACRPLWSLPMVFSWVEYRIHYHNLIMTGALWWDGPRFQISGARATITLELLLIEEFEERGITMDTLQRVFPLHQAPPLPVPSATAQGPPSPPAPITLKIPSSPVSSRSGNAHVVVHICDTPDIMVISSDSVPMEDSKEDLEEDLEFEVHHIYQVVEEAESSASNCSFDLNEEPEVILT